MQQKWEWEILFWVPMINLHLHGSSAIKLSVSRYECTNMFILLFWAWNQMSDAACLNIWGYMTASIMLVACSVSPPRFCRATILMWALHGTTSHNSYCSRVYIIIGTNLHTNHLQCINIPASSHTYTAWKTRVWTLHLILWIEWDKSALCAIKINNIMMYPQAVESQWKKHSRMYLFLPNCA